MGTQGTKKDVMCHGLSQINHSIRFVFKPDLHEIEKMYKIKTSLLTV